MEHTNLNYSYSIFSIEFETRYKNYSYLVLPRDFLALPYDDEPTDPFPRPNFL